MLHLKPVVSITIFLNDKIYVAAINTSFFASLLIVPAPQITCSCYHTSMSLRPASNSDHPTAATSANGNQNFKCSGGCLRAMDGQTGIDRSVSPKICSWDTPRDYRKVDIANVVLLRRLPPKHKSVKSKSGESWSLTRFLMACVSNGWGTTFWTSEQRPSKFKQWLHLKRKTHHFSIIISQGILGEVY